MDRSSDPRNVSDQNDRMGEYHGMVSSISFNRVLVDLSGLAHDSDLDFSCPAHTTAPVDADHIGWPE